MARESLGLESSTMASSPVRLSNGTRARLAARAGSDSHRESLTVVADDGRFFTGADAIAIFIARLPGAVALLFMIAFIETMATGEETTTIISVANTRAKYYTDPQVCAKPCRQHRDNHIQKMTQTSDTSSYRWAQTNNRIGSQFSRSLQHPRFF